VEYHANFQKLMDGYDKLQKQLLEAMRKEAGTRVD
jgi:hypothetical protein